MKTRTIITTLLIAVCTNIVYATDFVTFKRNSLSDIELTGTSDTEVIGGFIGVMLGLFAQGEDGDGYADFDWFEYITE